MVEYINYKGEKLPVRISWTVIKGIESAKEMNVYEQTEVALYCALLSGYKAIGKEMKFTPEDMQFILDEAVEEFQAIFSKQMQKYIQKDTDGEKKKA